MGGRGSSRRIGSGTHVTVPDKKQRGRGRSQKLRGEAGSPYGTERPLPLQPHPKPSEQ